MAARQCVPIGLWAPMRTSCPELPSIGSSVLTDRDSYTVPIVDYSTANNKKHYIE